MASTAYVELSIERRERKYFVLVVDDREINEAGPLTKNQALKLHYMLALEAIEIGGKTQPIRRPKIKNAPRKKVPSSKPVKNYPISAKLYAAISQ